MNLLKTLVKKDLLIFFLFVILSSLQAYFYLSGYDVVVFWDQTHPLNTSSALDSLGSFWNNSGFPGAMDPSGTNFIPFLIILYILTFGDRFVTIGQFLFIFLNYLGSLWFSYKLLEEFYKFFNKSEKNLKIDISIWHKVIFIISSLFYTFNIFNLTFVLRITNTNIWLLPFIPLQAYLLLKLTKSKKIDYLKIALFVFTNSFFLAIYTKKTIIGNDVWIGVGAIIMGGVTIGDGAVIGAGAIVTKDVEPYTIVVGVPAKPLKKRFTEEQIKKIIDLKWWDWELEKIIENKHLFEKELSEINF